MGERGIGKSSLFMYLKFVAQGEIPIGHTKVHFLVVHTDVDQGTSQLGLVKKIELGIRQELEKSEPARAFLSEIWAFLQRVEAAGIRITPEQRAENEELLIEEFSYSLARLEQRICSPGQPQPPVHGPIRRYPHPH